MSFKEVKELRISGHLPEALEMAKEDLEKDPDNLWNKRSISWVYYAYLKHYQETNNLDAYIKTIKDINQLELPETEKMLFDSIAWSMGKLLFNYSGITPYHLDVLFDHIQAMYFSKPGDAYSFLIKAFKKQAKNWNRFYDLFVWWGADHFQKKDFEQFVTEDGKKLMANAEGIYIAVASELLTPPVDRTKIEQFIPVIAALTKTHPEMQYPVYYYAKLLLELGNKKKFLTTFIPFARKKKRDFWVWDLLSEAFDSGSDEYMSCLCRSLSCGAPDKFTLNVREKLAILLENKEIFSEAKFEYKKVLVTRQKEGWILKDKHHGWQKKPWWNNTIETKSNRKLYDANTDVAESLLYTDMPEEIIVIEKVNKDKSVLNFVVSKEKSGFASYRNLKVKPEVGGIYKVRFDKKEDTKSNFYKILSIRLSNAQPQSDIYREVNGVVKIKEGNSFGFVNNVFIPPQILTTYKLKNGNSIKGVALQTYNSKRKAWGWNIIKINK